MSLISLKLRNNRRPFFLSYVRSSVSRGQEGLVVFISVKGKEIEYAEEGLQKFWDFWWNTYSPTSSAHGSALSFHESQTPEMNQGWDLISTEAVSGSLQGIISAIPAYLDIIRKQENEERGVSDLKWDMNNASQENAVDWGFCPNWVPGGKLSQKVSVTLPCSLSALM